MLLASTVATILAFSQFLPTGADVRRLHGDSIRLGSGTVHSWVEVDAQDVPVAIGVSLPDDVIESVTSEGAMLSLDFPTVPGLPFRHVLFDWVPTGHPPAHLYHHPHWDAHFYLITAEGRRAIAEGPTAQQPASHHMPDGFIPVPGIGLYAFPEMGVHWVDANSAEVSGQTFSQTLIYGSVGEHTIFVEPMFTSAFLAGRPDFSAAIPQPAAVAEEGYYPTRYVIRYDPAQPGFRVSLEGFRWREAG
jgi:hypothetical protein